VMALGGGLAVADGGKILGTLPLPVAGLMTDAPIEDVRRDYDHLITLAHELGSTMHDPFMLMSFMGLEVIPKLKLTDIGLVDVEKFAVIGLFADEA
jgi:adenine deaminase